MEDYEIVEYPPPNNFLTTPLARFRTESQSFVQNSPMSQEDFESFFDEAGRLLDQEMFKKTVFKGGVHESIRKTVWKHLFGYYKGPASERERHTLESELNAKYVALKNRWLQEVLRSPSSELLVTPPPLDSSSQTIFISSSSATDPQEQFATAHAMVFAGRQPFDIRKTENNIRMIDKDVPRTDRTHQYYRGDQMKLHQNMLRDILITFSSYHDDIGYVQGMNDIASRFLIIFDCEADAYWCFAYYMNKFKDDFLEDGMMRRLGILRNLLNEIDGDLYSYLAEYGLNDLAFCHRWLLLNFLREFNFDDGFVIFEMICSEFLEIDSMEADRVRELSRQASLGADENVPEILITIDPQLTFNLFVCVAVLMENRKELFSCTEVTAVIQCMTRMPSNMTAGQIIDKAAALFYSYCQRSVNEGFQILEVPDDFRFSFNTKSCDCDIN